MTQTRVERWLERQAVKLVVLLFVLSAIGAGVTGWLILNEQTRLGGVELAGPCRARGIKYPECRRQARLIFAACADQPHRCADVYGIRIVRVEPSAVR